MLYIFECTGIYKLYVNFFKTFIVTIFNVTGKFNLLKMLGFNCCTDMFLKWEVEG